MINTESFKKACSRWCTGVAVITCTGPDGERFGLTMSAVTPLSLKPPLFLICLDNNSETLRAIELSAYFCINVLSDKQESTSNHFASKGRNKFNSIKWFESKNGCPVLDGALVNIECQKESVFSGGDHQVVIGQLSSLYFNDSENHNPLAYYKSTYHKVTKTQHKQDS